MVLVKSCNEAALIDTSDDKEQALRIKEYINKNNLQLKNIILTHMHDDQKRNIDMLKGNGVNVTTPFGAKDNEIISLGDKTIKILHTPGLFDSKHFNVEIDDEILVAGDIITTAESTQTCVTYDNFKALIETLERLKDNRYSLIIPGHGDICIGGSILDEHLQALEEDK